MNLTAVPPPVARIVTGLLLSALLAAPAFAVDGPGRFELDGNAAGLGANLDWQGLIADPPEPGDMFGGCSFITWTGIAADGVNETIFTGGRKDLQQISGPQATKGANNVWAHTSGSVPDKTDIANAYAAAFDCAGELVIYFGADRYATDGDSFLGFWFLQEDIGLLSGGRFSGRHVDGDTLVLVNFERGGEVPKIGVYEWHPGYDGADVNSLIWIKDGNTPILIERVTPDLNAIKCDGQGNKDFCAVTNSDSIPLFWSYTPKGGAPGDDAPPRAFFEGGINITRVLPTEVCITAFVAETRASSSPSADLKDFIAGNFNVCGLDVTKDCTNPRLGDDGETIVYDISGSINTRGGTLFDISLTDNPPADGDFQHVDCQDPETVLGAFPLDSLNGEACYFATMTVDLADNGLKDTVTATAYTAPDEGGFQVQESATADCPLLQVSPDLAVDAKCETSVVVQGGTVVASVTISGEVCNIGDSPLFDVVVIADPETNPDPMVGPIDLARPDDPADPGETEGACSDFSGTYLPSVAKDEHGEPTTDPTQVWFTSSVEASAEDIFGEEVQAQAVSVSCRLCDCEEDCD